MGTCITRGETLERRGLAQRDEVLAVAYRLADLLWSDAEFLLYLDMFAYYLFDAVLAELKVFLALRCVLHPGSGRPWSRGRS